MAEGERVVQPLKSFRSPVLDLCVPKAYLAHQRMFDPSFRHGNWYYVRSCDVAALTDDVIDVMVEYGQQITSPVTSVASWQMGGAVARVEERTTAFHGRHAGVTFNINGNSETADGFEDRRHVRVTFRAPSPLSSSGAILNAMDAGAVYQLPVQRRHFALDERGVGLRATWHADRGFVNVSLWSGDRCVQTFHLTPVEAGRLVGFLAGVLADAVPEPSRPSGIAPVSEPGRDVDEANRWSTRMGRFRREVAASLDRAARRLQS